MDEFADLREGVRGLCAQFPPDYWRSCDQNKMYPEEFVAAMTASGYLAALIPEEFGGSGLGVLEASIILEEVNRSGGNAAQCHAQMYTMGTVLRHGSKEQKSRWLPGIASGSIRLQAFGVTEPGAGSDTTHLTTTAVRDGNRYRINGQKIFISRVQHSDYLLLLARTTPLSEVKRRSQGLSVFMVDLSEALTHGLRVAPIATMMNHETNALFFDDVPVPADNLIGEQGEGFRYILDGMNAERILIAGECLGDGYFFIDRATAYARERIVFDRPIGQNQGIQFPLARAYAHLKAADLTRLDAAKRFDHGEKAGEQANIAKLLASEASWEAANQAIQTYGGYGFAVDYDIERKFRETRLFQVAPISTNLILAYLGEHVLGLPRSY
ncbi:MAG: acyl-CoA/acyl-ACP dehydrogenase [Firmicutes bacterium]|jgi:acyl-CoA dehydrogenase|uniref:Acyl-CoA dehydrogenase n=1 Tax=Sulfobacillus benefaciens TaxID=453960 RepID=A0A2T2X383_9FIRM|nr:acyl-CoA/acyl-ACP dehydrogenase [Bacillota bacterium]MCL5014496.1 acyl-CoA/acyl-ACP dehydrogenase [Bacillota bacterium]PSR28916.1 MAG: acyl-CoA dehydrogenase [Sulfobacillus benefaciens]